MERDLSRTFKGVQDLTFSRMFTLPKILSKFVACSELDLTPVISRSG